MKDLTIYIPTYGRADSQITYDNLSPEIQKKVVLVVHPKEKKLYDKKYNIVLCPKKTIAAKRAWIIENCPTKYLIMIDDDLQFYIRRDLEGWRLRYSDKGEDINIMFEAVYKSLKEDGYVHVGISDRSGNNHVKGLAAENTRMFGFLAYNRDVVLKNVEFNRVKFHEDFDINLQLLYKGYPNLVYYYFAKHDIAGFNSEGGVSTERTLENHNNSVRNFAEVNKGFCTVRTTKKKSQEDEFSERLELIIYWKRAFESSKK